jgi:hypothetical protein
VAAVSVTLLLFGCELPRAGVATGLVPTRSQL